MKILGIVGNLGVGKDTIADILHKDHNFKVAALADELKRVTGLIFDIPTDVMFGASALRATRDERVMHSVYWGDCDARIYANRTRILNIFPHQLREQAYSALHRELHHFAKNSEKCTARYLLQRMGTEWGRSVYKNVWIDSLERTILDLQTGHFNYKRETGLSIRDGLKIPVGFAITDVRFDNEIEAVQRWGGKAVWVDASERVKPSGETHTSEPTYAQMKDLVDGKISNNGTLQELKSAVSSLVQDEEFWQ